MRVDLTWDATTSCLKIIIIIIITIIIFNYTFTAEILAK